MGKEIEHEQKKDANPGSGASTVIDNNSSPIKVDGVCGPQTEIEIKKIQEKLNIEQDGNVNASILSKMEALLTKLNFKNEQKIDLIK